MIAEVIPQDGAEANARLIALAPELEEFVREFVEYGYCECSEEFDNYECVICHGRALLRKLDP